MQSTAPIVPRLATFASVSLTCCATKWCFYQLVVRVAFKARSRTTKPAKAGFVVFVLLSLVSYLLSPSLFLPYLNSDRVFVVGSLVGLVRRYELNSDNATLFLEHLVKAECEFHLRTRRY